MNNVAFKAGTRTDIACPYCGPATMLVVRENRESGRQFLGCPKWPECGFAREIPEEWKMRAAGQTGLFDGGEK